MVALNVSVSSTTLSLVIGILYVIVTDINVRLGEIVLADVVLE